MVGEGEGGGGGGGGGVCVCVGWGGGGSKYYGHNKMTPPPSSLPKPSTAKSKVLSKMPCMYEGVSKSFEPQAFSPFR